MTLFLTVTHLFAVNRTNAIATAPEIFSIFERYQIILAAASILFTAIWRLSEPRALLTALFGLFALASVGTIISATLIMPKMQRLHQAGQSSGPEFLHLHIQSMIIYTADAGILMLAGFVLIAALQRRTVPLTAPASALPADPADSTLSA